MSKQKKTENIKTQFLPIKVLIDANLKKEGYVMCGHKVTKTKNCHGRKYLISPLNVGLVSNQQEINNKIFFTN